MYDWLFMIFIIIAILFMIFAVIFYDNQFWCAIFTVVDIIIWFFLSATILEIEQPYQMYNMTSGNIESGITITTSKIAPEMMYMFMLFAFIMIIFLTAYIVFPTMYDLVMKDKRYINDREYPRR